MKDSFFMAPKRKKQKPQPKAVEKKAHDEESVYSEDTDPDFRVGDIDTMDLTHNRELDEESASDVESARQKRVRLAQEYIDKVKKDIEITDGFDAAEIDREIIESRLKRDHLESEGRLRRYAKPTFSSSSFEARVLRGSNQSVTCAVMTPNEAFVYSGSKDGTIIKHDLLTAKKVHIFRCGKKSEKDHLGHTGGITCLAVSDDGKYFASGSRDKTVCVWSVESDKLLTTFKQHRDEITGLAFRQGTVNSLYSSSSDRTIKVYNIDEMAYVETLFGHQDKISCLDSMGYQERCVSAGGRDRTVRLWKIVEESQLVFRASSGRVLKNNYEKTHPAYYHAVDETGSLDVVSFIDDQTWVTGSDGGTLSVWNIQRKKPVVSVPNAHGRTVVVRVDDELVDGNELTARMEAYQTNIFPNAIHVQSFLDNLDVVAEKLEGREFVSNANWITAVTAVPFSDLIASGSTDGKIRLWKLHTPKDETTEEKKRLKLDEIVSFPVVGFVNSLRFSKSGQYLIAGVGKEHRDGRWANIKQAKNSTVVISLGNIFE